MTSKLRTIFGEFEAPKDDIICRDLGGSGHSCRRTFALVNNTTGAILDGVDIQGRKGADIEKNVLNLLTKHGFKKVEPSPAAA